MSQGSNRFFSLAYKNAVFYIILILLSSLLIGYFIYRQSTNIILESSEQNAIHIIEVLDVKLQSYFDNVRKDVLFISRSPYLKDYVQAIGTSREEGKRMNLTADYVSFLSSKPDYAQIRFIGIQQNGKEVIRVDRMNNSVMVISPQELQEKGNTSYFKETMISPEDSVSFSIIDLNKEHGKISHPVMPTIRVSCPIWINGSVIGIAVINTNLISLFRDLHTSISNDYDLYLFNQAGQCMIHPDSTKSFAFEYGKEHSFFTENGIDPDVIHPGTNHLNAGDNHFYIKKIKYPKHDFGVFIALRSYQNKLLATFYKWRWSILGITLMISSLIMLLALWWLRQQSRSMEDIVDAIIRFEQDLETKSLPVSRNDEIGIIARTFGSMASTIKKNITSLAIAKKEAEQANTQKEEFLQNMSHEIRNPLHTILGMSRMLQDNTPRPDQQPIIESLKFSSQTLLALVNDILDFSKLKEGKISLTTKTAQIGELLDNIIKSYSYDALTRRITIKPEIDLELYRLQVVIDTLRFSQVMNNLLSNAIKFSPQTSEVKVVAEIVQADADLCSIKFSVLDQGPGIPADKLDLVMQRFQQLNDENRDQIGTGLGLPIVVQILQLFQSGLQFAPVSSNGSNFFFVLKLPVVQNRTETLIRKYSAEQWENILIVDDDPQITMLYEHFFSDQKISHKVIQDIADLRDLDTLQFDALITDNYLGQNSVLKYIPVLKKVTGSEAPKVLLTGDHNLIPLLIGSEGFFDCILQKPVQTDELLQVLSKVRHWKKGPLPKLQSLYHDYDFDRNKIRNALHLLISEWKISSEQLRKAIIEHNNPAKNAIVHKLANSLRRFQLESLEKEWKNSDISAASDGESAILQSLTHFDHCIEYISYQEVIWNS